jgi:hypothetical protein
MYNLINMYFFISLLWIATYIRIQKVTGQIPWYKNLMVGKKLDLGGLYVSNKKEGKHVKIK